MSVSTKRRFPRQASNSCSGCNQLRKKNSLSVSCRKTRRILGNSDKLKFQIMQKCPALMARHIVSRLDFAETHVTRDILKWSRIMLSNEKRFILDWLDVFISYLQDFRKEPRIFSTRQYGRGGLVVWRAFSFSGNTNLVLLLETKTRNAILLVWKNNLYVLQKKRIVKTG